MSHENDRLSFFNNYMLIVFITLDYDTSFSSEFYFKPKSGSFGNLLATCACCVLLSMPNLGGHLVTRPLPRHPGYRKTATQELKWKWILIANFHKPASECRLISVWKLLLHLRGARGVQTTGFGGRWGKRRTSIAARNRPIIKRNACGGGGTWNFAQ